MPYQAYAILYDAGTIDTACCEETNADGKSDRWNTYAAAPIAPTKGQPCAPEQNTLNLPYRGKEER